MPRKAGGARRKRRTHIKPLSSDASLTEKRNAPPRSFVLRRGKIPAAVGELINDLRQMLMPHTAAHLKERKSNNLRDFVSIATQVGVTHFWMLSATAVAPYLRLATIPQGPTLSFRITAYTPSVHVRAAQRRPAMLQTHDLDEPPLLVLNNFSGEHASEPAIKLVAETFRHSFPPIDVNNAKLSALRRVMLVHRDPQSGLIHIRHYIVRVQPAGLSKPVRKLVTKRRIPKLSKLSDVAQLMDGSAPPGVFSSDSEMEGTNSFARVTLPQPVKALRKGASSTIKLVEVGPRVTLSLVKAQAGLCDGAVLFHNFISKSREQAEADRERVEGRRALKRKRKEEQEANVRRKQEVKRAKKERRKKNAEARLAAEKEAEQREAKEHQTVEAKKAPEGPHEIIPVDEDGYDGEASGEDSDKSNLTSSGEE